MSVQTVATVLSRIDDIEAEPLPMERESARGMGEPPVEDQPL